MAKKKKSPAQPGVDPNEKRRERLEAKRAARAATVEAQRKKERRERWIRRLAWAALFGFAVWFLFLRTATPDEINGNPINTFSTAGANQHTTTDVPYQDVPPVSGQHAPRAGMCGVFSAAIQDEVMVHNLEHGAVGLLYQPDLELRQIRQLEKIVGDYEDSVFSMPYPRGMQSPITVIAWGHTMELDEVDQDSIKQFIEEFRRGGSAPEGKSAEPCEYQTAQPYQPVDLNATPSPGAEPTPEPEASPTG